MAAGDSLSDYGSSSRRFSSRTAQDHQRRYLRAASWGGLVAMIYLLDVNVLVALRYTPHAHHARATCWLDGYDRHYPSDRFATCSVTEIGFVRIACSKRVNLAKTIGAAREDLARLKEDRLTM